MLTALLDGTRVYATRAEKGGNYRCPGCAAEMILRKGEVRIHHFAHRPEITCGWGTGETEAHLEAKLSLYNAFKDRSLRAEAEWIVPHLGGDRRADVFIWEMGAGPIALELQHSSISLAEIAARTESYMAAGIAVIWLPFLEPAAMAEATSTGALRIARYLPRPFERWIESFTHGPVWYWCPLDSSLYRGRFDPYVEWSESATWTDRRGSVQVDKGSWERVPRYATLVLEGPLNASNVTLRRYLRKSAQSGKHRIPAGPAAAFEAVARPVILRR